MAKKCEDYLTPLDLGLRVVRGPDWKWGDQDGGSGHVGTVVEIGSVSKAKGGTPDKTVVLQWDNGTRTNYRVGHQNAFDLRVFDNATAGIFHADVSCYECQSPGIFGIRWSCSRCSNVNLCSLCYHSDKHDLTHSFRRFDCPNLKGTFEVSPRARAEKVALKGMFPGAEVKRSFDWVWQDQDGGPGSVGVILQIEGWENETARSVARVTWKNMNNTNNVNNVKTFQYRTGHQGKLDLQYLPGKFATFGHFYMEHLPVLGQVQVANFSPKRTKEFTEKKFKIGEQVRIGVDLETLQSLQEGHGNFHSKMRDIVSKVGKVHRITTEGNVRVQYPGKPENGFRWTIHPAALVKVCSFEIGDIVKVLDVEEEVRRLQADHGEWVDTMRMALGKIGKVTRQDSDGDVRLFLNGQTWTFNPACLTKVVSGLELITPPEPPLVLSPPPPPKEKPDKKASDIDPFVLEAGRGHADAISRRLQNQSVLPLDFHVILRGLLAAAKQGHLSVVKAITTHSKLGPELNSKSNGKTAIHIASLYGNLDIVDHMLSIPNSSLQENDPISSLDDDLDNALHYAVIGKQPTVMEFLIERGININHINIKHCSALHYAVNIKADECIRVLVKHKIQVNLQDESGDTALHDAIRKQLNEEQLDLLCHVSDLDPSLVNRKGFNCLQLAAMKGNWFVVKSLLKLRPDLTNVKKSSDGFAPMHLAALNGSVEVTKILLGQLGIQVDVTDRMGRTPLHHACMQGFYKVVELLLHNGNGANVDILDCDFNTPLHLVLSKESLSQDSCEAKLIDELILNQVLSAGVPEPWRSPMSIALLLILKGADPKLKNREGKSCFDLVSDLTCRALLLEKSLKSSVNLKDDHDPIEEEIEKFECQICCETTQLVEFKPCGHKLACSDCSRRMKKCLECKSEIKDKVISGNDRRNSNNSNNPKVKVKDLEAKLRDLEDQCLCSICMERKKNVIFLCGHGACSECVETLKCCHMCRGQIIKKINVY